MNLGLNYNIPELPVERFINFYKLFIKNGHKIFELSYLKNFLSSGISVASSKLDI